MKVAYSCVVDAHAKFEWQAFLWAHSLIEAGVDAECLRVHCMPGVTEAFRNQMTQLGAAIFETTPFPGHVYCNKIQQFTSNAFEGFDRIVLTDCDLFFLRAPSLPQGAAFAAGVVNLPNPPLPELKEIYRQAGVTESPTVLAKAALTPADLTLSSNVNGGFYAIDPAVFPKLGDAWRRHARWLLERMALLGATYQNHVDQVALALALDELQISVSPLSPGVNFTVHLPPDRLQKLALAADRIDAVHYHAHMHQSGTLDPTRIASIDAVIAQVNARIEAIIERDFDNALFWNWRYANSPIIGPGIGSRGSILDYKRHLLTIATAPFADKSVLDIGCGDLETTRELKLQNYTGIDVSENALEIARTKRPDWRFASEPAAEHSAADLVICLDVLIQQKDPEEYKKLARTLIDLARERLIVSGYNKVPTIASHITGFHEPLSKTLLNAGVFREITRIGSYRDLDLFVADKRAVGNALHANDVTTDVFYAVFPRVDRKDLLLAAMDTSREAFGFFTNTSIRMVEYPWMYEKLLNLSPGARVLDIGAGVSPLPIMIANRGVRVDCVDSHPHIVEFSRRHEWNEWGFLDYAQIHSGIRSFHTNVIEYQPDEAYDVVYSVSVIEHMPRPVWEATIDRAAAWLAPRGRLLLTLDLVPGTLNLWNRSEGQIVDSEGTHGTVNDVVSRIGSQALTIEQGFVMDKIPHSRTDVLFIAARKA